MGIYLSHTLYVVLSLSGSSVQPLWMKAQQVNTSEKYEHFVKLFMGQCKQWGKWRCSVLIIYVLYFITPQRIWNRVSCLWCMRQTSDTEWVVARHGAVESRPVTCDGTVVSDLHPLCYLHRFLSQTPFCPIRSVAVTQRKTIRQPYLWQTSNQWSINTRQLYEKIIV